MPTLHHVLLIERHVVAQVVEAHLVVGAVGDVAGVGLAALGRGQAVDDQADGQTHEAVHLAHPFAVAAGEVVVDGDDMYALAGQGVEVGRKDGDKGLALAGLHLGDAPLMEHDAAYELHAEGLHAQHAPRGLAHGGEGLRQELIQRFAVIVAGFEFLGLGTERVVRQGGVFRLQLLYRIGDRIYFFQLTVIVAAENLIEKSHCVCLS